MAGFVWGEAGAQLSPAEIAAQRKIADALISQGTEATPIKHWTQGIARVAQALYGGYQSKEADAASKANREYENGIIRDLPSMFGGTSAAGATSPAPLASTPTEMSGGTPTPTAMAPSVNNKIYSDNEPSPLDPPSGKDRDLAIRTVYGEDPGASASGVANVVRNRMVAGKFGGDTVGGVVLAKNQFEPWNRDDARARMMQLDPNSAEYKRLGAIVDQAWTGTDDPTKGATHFFSPSAQAALGRPVPKWGMAGGQDIGTHRFFGGAASPTMVATAPVPAAAGGVRPGGPVPSTPTTWGDKEAQAAGLYETPAAPATLNQRFAGSPGAPADPEALPPNATPAQYVAPGTGQVIPAAPTAGAAPASSGPLAGINPRLVQAMASDRIGDGTKKIIGLMLQHQMSEQGVTMQDLGGAIGVFDKRGNLVRQIAKTEPVKQPDFGVVSKVDGEEVYGWRDPRNKSVDVFTPPGAANAAPATVMGPDGKQQPIPTGVDRKLYKSEMTKIAADAAGGKKTETQANSENYGNRMEDAEGNLKSFEPAIAQNGWGTFKDRALRGMSEPAYSPIPRGATNWAVSNDYQRFEQAKSQWITAKLRKESGAAIGKEEFDREDREFFPQAGDSADVIAQKQQARAVALGGMKKGAGPGYKSPVAPPVAGDVPKGVDPNIWKHMTPEERALWTK